MRRWLIRSCWLAAWGAWCWAGYGLWRELPRKSGHPFGKLDFQKHEGVFGLNSEQSLVITAPLYSGEPPLAIRVWDLDKLRLARTIPIPKGAGVSRRDAPAVWMRS